MSEEILINVATREVRAALLLHGVLQEVHIERAARRGIIGNIYQGKVVRVLPGMQAAFVELGLERTAFLHVSDIQGADAAPGADIPEAAIRALVREGDQILVQVMKDAIGTKGARLTTYITVPSRYLVLLPREATIGVSARIEDEAERERLKGLVQGIEARLQSAGGPACGYIVRTAAEGVDEAALEADMRVLRKLWERVAERARTASAPALVHEDLPLAIRVVRDLVTPSTTRVQVDDAEALAGIREFARTFLPELAAVIGPYEGSRPIFDLHGVEEEIGRALDRKVELKSGGYLIIDQTEAMTTIDVNTGAYVGHRNLEETIFRTNLEAAVAIARQLRLRNLGGIIIIDFIDMAVESHRRQVQDALRAALAPDHARSHIAEVSALGLVQMTRKRTRESLEHLLCRPCPDCKGRGHVKTPETVCYEIFREVLRQHRQFSFQELVVLAHQDVIELLLDEESAGIAELEELTGKPIRLQAEALYGPDQFDVVLV